MLPQLIEIKLQGMEDKIMFKTCSFVDKLQDKYNKDIIVYDLSNYPTAVKIKKGFEGDDETA